jgi:hypothetical protein
MRPANRLTRFCPGNGADLTTIGKAGSAGAGCWIGQIELVRPPDAGDRIPARKSGYSPVPLTRLKDYAKHAPKPEGSFMASCAVFFRTDVCG